MSLIIGTGGHVDHGKSSIIKYLTKVEPDRLDEEKQRGLTIIPSYIPFENSSNELISFIDVPGHEKFINNMIKGSHGIDILMLIVAADDGIMPQTLEHLSIAFYLGIRKVILVLNKTDLCENIRVVELEKQLISILDSNGFEILKTFYTSCRTESGLKGLFDYLKNEISASDDLQDEKIFRMPVDRVFKIAGSGLIVTGTVVSGSAEVNGNINISGPDKSTARIRDIEVHGLKSRRIEKGHRGGLNLVVRERRIDIENRTLYSGIKRFESDLCLAFFYSNSEKKILRGEYSFHSGTFRSSARIKCLYTYENELHRKKAGAFFRHKQVILIALKEKGLIQWGDKFILRSSRTKVTVGGGRVVFALNDRKILTDKVIWDDESVLFEATTGIIRSCDLYSEIRGCVPIEFDFISQFFPYSHEYMSNLFFTEKSRFVFSKKGNGKIRYFMNLIRYRQLGEIIYNSLSELHRDYPEKEMFSTNDVITTVKKTRALPMICPDSLDFYFSACLEDEFLNEIAEKRKSICFTSGKYRLQGYKSEFPKRLVNKRQLIINKFKQSGDFRTVSLASMCNDFNDIAAEDLDVILKSMCTSNYIIPVAEKEFIESKYIEKIKLFLHEFFSENAFLKITDFKDRFKIGRKSSILLLEYFDSIGYTKRVDNLREPGPELFSK
jgi:selenocysteine-specific elongation factor